MKKIYLTVLLGFISFVINAQETVDFAKPKDNYDPLFKLTDIPVSLNNGMTNIEIPLYTISTKDIDLPIKLSYYSRGQKLSEISSEVGLGWNINIPYKISRQVADKEDEGNDGYFNNNIYKKNIFKDKSELLKIQSYSNLDEGYDVEPDKFYLNLPNYSGKFIYDQVKGDFIMQDFEAYKIERIYGQSNTLNGFKVIDPNGNTYLFGIDRQYYNIKTLRSTQYIYSLKNTGEETGIGYTTTENPGDYPSSWYLYKIITKNKEEILFSYLPHTLNYFDRGYEEATMFYREYGLGGEEETYNSFFSNYDIDDRAIDLITFRNGTVKFNYSERDDVLVGQKLESVIVRDLKNNPIKTVNLNYFYTTAYVDNLNSHPYLIQLDPTAYKRLYLDQVIVNNTEKTLFSYYSPENLPNRFSNSFDVWGFYNNELNGKFIDISGLWTKHKKQSVNTSTTKYGLLKQITYPTKGTTTFEYENNTGKLSIYDPKVLLRDIPYVKSPIRDSTVIYVMSNNRFRPNYDTFVDGDGFYKEFLVPKNVTYKNGFEANLSYGKLGHQDPEVIIPGCQSVIGKILDKNNNEVVLYPSAGPPFNTIISTPNQELNFRVHLTPGEKYKMKTEVGGCEGEVEDYEFSLKLLFYLIEEPEGEKYVYGEGNRIKSIINNSNNGNIEKKSYIYKSLDNKNNTGRIIGYPFFHTKFGNMNNIPKTTIIDPFGVRPGSLMSSYNVNSLIYSEVTEYIGDPIQNNGKIHYKFSDNLDGGKYYRWPYYTSIDNEYLRGKLLNKKVYKNDNNQYKLISEEVNQYDFKDPFFKDYINLNNGFLINNGEKMSYYLRNKDAIIFPIPRFYYNMEGKFSNYIPDDFFLISNKTDDPVNNLYFQPFYFVSVKKYLTNQKNIQYFDNGTSVITETNYNYDSPNHLQLSKETTQTSKGETLTTDYQYPPDLVGQEDYMKELTDANRIVEPVVVKQSVEGVYISEVHNQYNLFNGIVEKAAVHQKKGNSININTTTDRKITYNSYDNQGNLTQYTLENRIPVAIIWGYGGQYPVAKIEGFTFANATSKLANYLTKIQNGTLTVAEQSTIRTLIPDAMITTYTYKPLVGVTSITGPNGQTEYYNYDAANRLQDIRNDKQEVLKTFQYNYKQP